MGYGPHIPYTASTVYGIWGQGIRRPSNLYGYKLLGLLLLMLMSCLCCLIVWCLRRLLRIQVYWDLGPAGHLGACFYQGVGILSLMVSRIWWHGIWLVRIEGTRSAGTRDTLYYPLTAGLTGLGNI